MEEYSSKDLDHLGIVSAMCDEINLVSMIDQLIPPRSPSYYDNRRMYQINGHQ
ncbi:DUF4277 domain-containing protein [Neochlamydia sp. TUME1]|uniref:DUF4277 domain-containing protein n=1 Tax=unclassified Neochlamydia TaxID=2643326 RepID=UPI0009B5A7B5|nr:DUF4277 domain-containing protein [Neochlamydia sp. TUME1]